jgi:hypothetical protein
MANKYIFATLFSFALAISTLAADEPELRPGEAFALISQNKEDNTWVVREAVVTAWGDADAPSPLGNLSKLLWLRLESAEWDAHSLEIKCKGELFGMRCGPPKGHGKVDVAKSFKEDCTAAFGTWVNLSRNAWKKDYGEGFSRIRFMEIFGPFLGDRLPKQQPLPPVFGTEWFADGHLLQASPRQLAQWLASQSQERLLRTCRIYMLGFKDFSKVSKKDAWWLKAAEAPALQSGEGSGNIQAWAIGGNESTTVLLRLPPGTVKKDAEARFRELMGMDAKKK